MKRETDLDDDLGFQLPPPAKVSRTRAVAIGASTLAVLGGAFVAGYLPRHRAKEALASEPKAGEGPLRVQVLAPKELTSDRALMLPASVLPLEETVIYARATGYVRKWYADMGDVVKEGAVLADLDTPELDRDLAKARGDLGKAEAGVLQAQATSDRADRELARYEQLAASGVGSKQDLDRVSADAAIGKASIKVANAVVSAERANVQRLVLLKSYSTLVSPFAGMITSRTIERGALVTTGNTVPLFKIAATDTVRVMLQVPQNIAPSVKLDQVAKVHVREFPGKPFEGKVAHLSGALDPATRTMLTEVRVPNPNHTLLAGMYVQVALTLPTPHRVLELPAASLLNDAKGLRVAIVDGNDVVHFVPVELERDTGAAIEIASGLKGDERVIKLASVDLVEGRKVQVVP